MRMRKGTTLRSLSVATVIKSFTASSASDEGSMTYTTPSDKIRGLKTIFHYDEYKALEALMYDNYFSYREMKLLMHIIDMVDTNKKNFA